MSFDWLNLKHNNMPFIIADNNCRNSTSSIGYSWLLHAYKILFPCIYVLRPAWRSYRPTVWKPFPPCYNYGNVIIIGNVINNFTYPLLVTAARHKLCKKIAFSLLICSYFMQLFSAVTCSFKCKCKVQRNDWRVYKFRSYNALIIVSN